MTIEQMIRNLELIAKDIGPNGSQSKLVLSIGYREISEFKLTNENRQPLVSIEPVDWRYKLVSPEDIEPDR